MTMRKILKTRIYLRLADGLLIFPPIKWFNKFLPNEEIEIGDNSFRHCVLKIYFLFLCLNIHYYKLKK